VMEEWTRTAVRSERTDLAGRVQRHALEVLRVTWLVTLLDCGHEVTIEVIAATKEQARREAREWHPNGHIIHVEKSCR
jgi:hypothetical protein